MTLISQSEWARRNGFSRQYVNNLINNGKIELKNGKIDEDDANEALKIQKNPNLPTRRNLGESYAEDAKEVHIMYAKARLKNEVERGKILEARAKTEIGQLVSAEAVKNAMFAKGRIIRDGMMNIPDRVSALLATINDASQIHEILSKEIREVLEELSRDD
jgi:phage terminase Nu1 subunit (DNA packaging protein)